MPTVSKQSILKLYQHNRREHSGLYYTVPSPISYPYQWLWDSCFHAIVLRYFDTKWAKQELLSVVSKQFDDGMLPHMIYWTPGNVIQVEWGKPGTSSITQPPIIATAVSNLLEQDNDTDFLDIIYPKIKKFYQYLLTKRDVRGHHIIGIINPDESGEDNSPRFDLALGLPPEQTLDENFKRRLKLIQENIACDFRVKNCMENFFWVKDLPFNVLMIKNLRDMVTLAKLMKNDEDAHYFAEQAQLIAEALKQYMYEDGLYYSVYDLDYKKIKVKTWALFSPLYAGLFSQEEAKAVIQNHLLNPNEFWLKYPVPTTARDEAAFDPNGFWRGPTWISTNWFVFQGLLNYGYVDIAKEIVKASKSMLEKSGFRERFNPLTGQGLGATNFTWGGLIIDMEKTLAQYQKDHS